MRAFLALLFLSINLVAGRIAAAAPPPDAPLVEDRNIRVDALDFEAAMLRIPPEKRADFRVSYDRVTSVVDNIFVARSFAEKARALGLDKDPVLLRRVQQVQEELLAAAYAENLQKQALGANLEQRAHELFLADKAKFVAPETVHVEHILVGLNGRTREMAKARADEAYAKLQAGQDFAAMVAAYSDDPDKSIGKGDLGFTRPEGFVKPVREQIAKMGRKGEVSPPVESQYGYHIIRFVGRQSARPLPFEAVKKGIMASEREKVVKQKVDAAVTEVRSSPTAVAHRENVEALVVPIDDAVLKKGFEAQDAFARALEEKKAK